jgi:hypothetical protein
MYAVSTEENMRERVNGIDPTVEPSHARSQQLDPLDTPLPSPWADYRTFSPLGGFDKCANLSKKVSLPSKFVKLVLKSHGLNPSNHGVSDMTMYNTTVRDLLDLCQKWSIPVSDFNYSKDGLEFRPVPMPTSVHGLLEDRDQCSVKSNYFSKEEDGKHSFFQTAKSPHSFEDCTAVIVQYCLENSFKFTDFYGAMLAFYASNGTSPYLKNECSFYVQGIASVYRVRHCDFYDYVQSIYPEITMRQFMRPFADDTRRYLRTHKITTSFLL